MAGRDSRDSGTQRGNGPPVDRKVQAGLVVVPGGQGDDVMTSQKPAKLPRAADGRPLHAGARQLWNAFWASDAAQAVAWEADRHRLVRWIHCVNELLLVEGEFLAQRIVKGSMGQPRLSPLWAYIRDLLAEVERAEEVFGMNPRSRFRLGIEYGAARMTLERLTRTLDAPPHGQPIPDQYREAAG